MINDVEHSFMCLLATSILNIIRCVDVSFSSFCALLQEPFLDCPQDTGTPSSIPYCLLSALWWPVSLCTPVASSGLGAPGDGTLLEGFISCCIYGICEHHSITGGSGAAEGKNPKARALRSVTDEWV